MAEVIKNILYLLIAFLAPFWFPITQKIFTGNSYQITDHDWIFLFCVFIIPIAILWWAEKSFKADRIKEMKEAFKQALKEDREEFLNRNK